MEPKYNHPETVEVWISYFFKWGIPPREKTVTITWDEFEQLTKGKTESFQVKTVGDVEEIKANRFSDSIFPDNVDADLTRSFVGIQSDVLPKFIHVVRLK